MDFLAFKSFISTEALIIFYYIGALVLPIGSWLFFKWLIGKYRLIDASYENGKELLWGSLSRQQRFKLMALLITTFLFMELFWRMLFEFLIAYLQIRDALLGLQV